MWKEIGIAGKKVGATLHYMNINKYIQTLKIDKKLELLKKVGAVLQAAMAWQPVLLPERPGEIFTIW